MSHFTVLVVTKNGTKAEIEHQLAPFHEFECTGQSDEFIKNIDELPQVREEFAKQTDDKTLADYIEGYCGRERIDGDAEPDLEGAHKYGWYRVRNGEVVECVGRTNPDSHWDWWTIGGRWSDFFLPKKGTKATTYHGRKCEIDFEAMMDRAGDRKGAEWDKARASVDGLMADFVPWDTMRAKHKDDHKGAMAAYHAQPAVKAFNEKCCDWAGFYTRLEDFMAPREEVIAKARRGAISTFAFLRDRKWAEKGTMGWWACVSNEKSDWPEQFLKLLGTVADDEYLTVVDCHV